MWFILHNFTPCVRTRKTNSNLPHEKGEEIHSRKKEKKHTGSFFFSLHMMLTFLKSIIRPHFPNRKARFRGAKNPSFILKNHLFVSLFTSHLQKREEDAHIGSRIVPPVFAEKISILFNKWEMKRRRILFLCCRK